MSDAPQKRGRGRPKGTKNRPKSVQQVEQSVVPEIVPEPVDAEIPPEVLEQMREQLERQQAFERYERVLVEERMKALENIIDSNPVGQDQMADAYSQLLTSVDFALNDQRRQNIITAFNATQAKIIPALYRHDSFGGVLREILIDIMKNENKCTHC